MKNVTKRFTFLELLVVLAIIGILASILMPSLNNAREKVKSSVCKSNLNQIGVGAVLWTDDNGGWTASRNWSHSDDEVGTLKPYTKTDRDITKNTFSGLYHCPSLTRARLSGTVNEDYGYTSYGINGESLWKILDQASVDSSWLRGGHQLSEVVSPARKAYFAERGNNAIFRNYLDYSVSQSPTRWHPPFTGVYGKTNVVWFDGHVSIEPRDFASRGDHWDYYWKPLSD